MNESARYENGLALLERIDGAGGREALEALRDIAPDFGRFLVEFPFGDIYSRRGADLKTR